VSSAGQLTIIAMVESRIERGDKIETEQRSYISSRMLSAAAFADGARGHWTIENNLHWTLDVTFNEDQSHLRTGHGAKNLAEVRHFALNLVRQVADKRSIKRRRKRAAWDPTYLLEILGPLRCPRLVALPLSRCADHNLDRRCGPSAKSRHWIPRSLRDSRGDYDVETAENIDKEPIWPDKTMSEMLKIAFADRVIDNEEHPYVRRLRGILD
jgi:predicted transposase YbfD/YdcC